MSGGGIEAVLRDHVQVEGFDEIGVYWKYGCDCSWTGNSDDEHRAHVAAAVLAWLDARLTEGDVVEAVARNRWPSFDECDVGTQRVMRAYVESDLSAVRGVLGGEGL